MSAVYRHIVAAAFLIAIVPALLAQDSKVEPTWLHRYVPSVREAAGDSSSATCHFKPIFGPGDAESRLPRTVTRFAEVVIDARGDCKPISYDREEEIYFILKGSAVLHYGDAAYNMRANDFTYLAPGMKHSMANSSQEELRVLVMGFKIAPAIAISAASASLKIANLDDLKEQTVEGHPTSVQYKLMVGPRTGKRDAINEAYVVVDFFWMNFAPGGTNAPHHHEIAEEIYLVLDGQGEMVAGSGMDGVEGRYPAKAGDAYYFRQNCTVGFYNQNRAGQRRTSWRCERRFRYPRMKIKPGR